MVCAGVCCACRSESDQTRIASGPLEWRNTVLVEQRQRALPVAQQSLLARSQGACNSNSNSNRDSSIARIRILAFSHSLLHSYNESSLQVLSNQQNLKNSELSEISIDFL